MRGTRTRVRKSDVERPKREKPGPRSGFETVHQARDLRKLIKDRLTTMYGSGAVSDCSDEVVEAAVRSVKEWLMDCAHEKRMTRELLEQTAIERVIDKLN